MLYAFLETVLTSWRLELVCSFVKSGMPKIPIYKTNISQFAFRESLVSCRCGSTRVPFVNKTFDGLVCVGFVAFSWFPYALN